MITWRHLAERIEKMTEEQKDTDVTVYVKEVDEYLEMHRVVEANEKTNDVLDDKHPYLE